MKSPETLQEAILYFSDEKVCIDTFVGIRWADDKPVCPACEHKEHWYLAKQRRFKCKECLKQFTVKMGTLLEDSPIPLSKWFPALWMLVNDKNGISSYELGKALKITQKSAWFVLHRLRTALQTGSFEKKLGGPGGIVESDETYIGGKSENMHKSRKLKLQRLRNQIPDWKASGRSLTHTAVHGILDREQRKVRAAVVPNVKRVTLQAAILEHVEHGASVYTDEANSYYDLPKVYSHDFVNHLREYVRGQVHTNGIENFWSLLKRTLKGTYVAVEPFHLQKYVDEQAWRFNNRGGKKREDKVTDGERFEIALAGLSGKRLTYDELTGKEEQAEVF